MYYFSPGMESVTKTAELQGLHFSYPGVPVFEDITLSIPLVGVTQIVGPNGGGKTTLARLLLGLLEPQGGTVRVLGTVAAAARRRIGYVPQHSLYDPQFPALAVEVVMTGLLHRSWGIQGRRQRRAAEEALEQLGLEQLANRSFSALSGGQRQRVLLARALVAQPQVLILDEPTANVDQESARRLEELILNQKERFGILLITHDFDFLARAVDRVLCVNRNAHLHERSSLSDTEMSRLFSGHFHALAQEHGHTHG